MKMGKKGISTVVATVLILLITVVAVSALWVGVTPIIKDKIKIEKFNISPNVNNQEDNTNKFGSGENQETNFGEGNKNNNEIIYVLNCMNLTQANTVYKLNRSLINGDVIATSNKNCFDIRAENITLDCQNYQIKSNNSDLHDGIFSKEKHTIIKNCNISLYYKGQRGKISAGIRLYNSSSSKIENNVLTNNFFGIYTNTGKNIIIKNNIIKNNSNGIKAHGTSYKISNNIIKKNKKGIITDSILKNSLINNNTIIESGEHGIMFSARGFNNNIFNNTIENNTINNSTIGISFYHSNNNIIKNNIIKNNNEYGLKLLESKNNIIVDNILCNNENKCKHIQKSFENNSCSSVGGCWNTENCNYCN